MTLTPGTRLGPYEVIAPLGAGGMGEVYRAKDTRLGRDVAIKVLPQHLSSNADVRTRFEREAKTVSSLNHPNICTLFDVGREADTDYLVMELVDGETLAQRLARGPMSMPEVLRLGAQIADALDRAHRAGVVHRDMKPGNVMLTKSGAKLMDFGLARASAMAGPVSGSGVTMPALTQHPTVASPLTAEGAIVGTFQYMSPEQLEGGEADSRSDVWALGCVLYEMVTGQRAFGGKSQASLISSIMKEEPRSLLEVAPVSPPALDRLVRACIAKEADDRVQTAHDVKLQLQWIAEAGSQSNVTAPALGRRWPRERTAWIAALAVVTIAAIAAVLFLPRGGSNSASVHASLLAPEGAVFSSGFSTPTPIAVSPDGSLVAFCARQSEGPNMLWVRSIGAADARPIAGTEDAWAPFFSPDGRSLGFIADTKLKRVAVAGGPVTTLYDGIDFRGASWGADGTIIMSPDGSGPVFRISDEGGPATPITVMDSLAGESTHRYPTFLPDGKHFLYLARRAGAGRGVEPAIYVAKLGSTERKRVLSVASNVVYASGHLLYVREGVLMAQPFDTGRLETTGPPVALQEGLRWEERFSRGVFAASQSGVLIFMTGSASTGSQLRWLDRAGKSLGDVGEPADYTYGGSPEISPDGRMALINVLNTGRGNSDACVVDLASGRRTRVTVDEGDHPAATWSSDGARIVVNDSQSARGSMEFRTLGGTRVDTILTMQGTPWPRDVSPDGRFVLYNRPPSPGSSVRSIIAVPSTGGGPELRVGPDHADAGMPQFSPDGRYIAYQSNETGRAEIFVATFPEPTGRWQISQGGGEQARWNRNGRELLYFDPSNRLQSVEVQSGPGGFQVGRSQPLFQFSGVGSPLRYDITPDGSRFLVTAPPANQPVSTIVLISNWTARLSKR